MSDSEDESVIFNDSSSDNEDMDMDELIEYITTDDENTHIKKINKFLESDSEDEEDEN